MECTQRLECTQDFNAESFTHRSGPEQVGFLGICGQTYPVNLGPNKIGRDPQTCNIVLDMKSLSRQHAVINVLSKKEYMLMDLGSVNKTKLGIKPLQAYIPYPLKNGDTVQFGDVFGIFRLCEEETELPMTQQCDIPDTPVPRTACTSGPRTLVPESPDISDKDDSFVASSQQAKEPQFKTPKTHFIKTSGKTILRPCIGGNKIDNIYWNSSQKSPLMKLDESDESLNDTSSTANTVQTVLGNSNDSRDIHDMDTQVPPPHNSPDSIYTASTQLPTQNNSPSIHSLATQIPFENLPYVHKVEQNEMQFELAVSCRDDSIHNAQTQGLPNNDINEAETQTFQKENEKTIHEMNTQFISNSSVNDENTQLPKSAIHAAQTQLVNNDIEDDIPLSGEHSETKTQVVTDEKTSESDEEILEVFGDIDEAEFTPKKPVSIIIDPLVENEATRNPSKSDVSPLNNRSKDTPSSTKLVNESDEEIMFQEADGQDFEAFASQPLLPHDISPSKCSDKENHEPEHMIREDNSQSPIIGVRRSHMRLDSDSSTDCEDIAMLPTQIILNKNNDDNNCGGRNKGDKKIEYDDILTQIIEEDLPKNSPILQITYSKKGIDKNNVDLRLDEMSTQIIEEDNLPKDTSQTSELDFEDMPTQIIDEGDINDSVNKRRPDVDKSTDLDFENMATQIIDEDVQQSESVFSEEIVSPFKIPFISPIKIKRKDLARHTTTKNIPKPGDAIEQSDKYYAATQEIIDDLCTQKTSDKCGKDNMKEHTNVDDEIVLCSDEEFEIADRFRHIEQVTPKKTLVSADVLSCEDDMEQKVNEYVSSLSANQIKDVVGLPVSVAKLSKKSSSDLSDVELTPKKVHPFKFMNALLPDSQEIKIAVTTTTRLDKTESSSESETESNSQENTPILFKKKVRSKKDAKVDLTKKFEVETLPTRVTGRMRKAPAKLLQDYLTEPANTEILKPKFLMEQEDNVDTEIIKENITRLRNTNKNKDVTKLKETHKVNSSHNEVKSKAGKEGQGDTEKKLLQDVERSNVIRTEENETDKLKNKQARKITQEPKERSSKKSEDSDRRKGVDKSNGVKNRPLENVDMSNIIRTEGNDNLIEEQKGRSNKKSAYEETKNRTDKSNVNNKEETAEILASTKVKSTYANDKPKGKGKPKANNNITDKTKTKERKFNEKTSEKSTNTKPPLVTKGILKNKTDDEVVTLRIDSDSEDSKPKSSRPIRSTRGRKKVKEHSVSPEPTSKLPEEIRPRPPSRRGKKFNSPPPEPVRRSKRQKNTDSQNDSQTEKPTKTNASKRIDSPCDSQAFLTASKKDNSQDASQSISASKTSKRRKISDPKQDQSTVYNISGESNTETPKRHKRPPALEVNGPNPKRTRAANANISGNMSLRSTTPSKLNVIQKVLFTAFSNEDVKSKLEKLGATIVSDVLDCDVLVTLQIKRTFKLLCVVGLGKPIVGPSWLQACIDNNKIVDPWLYLMRDEAAEKRFKFDLQRTLAGRRRFLEGWNVSTTPKVMPSAPEMRLIVESSGGTWKEGGSKWICVSTGSDKTLWPALKRRGADVVSTELILAGVLRQELDIEANKLC